MKTFVNIRGTNGSGKSTLARRFFGENDATVELVNQTFLRKKAEEQLQIRVTGRINPDTMTCVIGDYGTMAGGLDKVRTFEAQFAAINSALALADVNVVVAEGVLASTVFGSWADHSRKLASEGVRVVWAFLTTPVAECLRRIQVRNGGKPIKEELVRDKWEQIDKVRQRAELTRGIIVVQLPVGQEWETLQEAIK
jgi:predicted ABC-type ATPase